MSDFSIDDVLGTDHQQLDGLLLDLEQAVAARSPAAADARSKFARLLGHHMSWEDEALFPAVKSVATQAQRRSIESLEIDHERLRDTLHSLEATLGAGDYEEARRLTDWLRTLLRGHNYDEEHGVYVEADRLLEQASRERLVAWFRDGFSREVR